MKKEVLKKRQKMKSWLRRGDLKLIIEACDMHKITIYRWFDGLIDNSQIELVVERFVEARKKEAEEAAEKIINEEINEK